MKKMLKRSLATILAICMMVSMIPATVVNAAGDEYTATFVVDGSITKIIQTVDQKIEAPEGRFMEGYTFWGWVTEWLEAFDEGDTITLTDDTVFYGVYDYNKYDVKLSSSSSTHATVTGIPDIGKYNDDYTFTVQPEDGYEVVAVTASYWRNSVPVSKIDENKYSFVVPSGDVTVKVVTRKADSFTIKVDNGTASANTNCLAGKTYTLPITLDSSVTVPDNSVWVGWKDADTSLVYDAGATITAIKNYHIVPAFDAVSSKEYTGTFCADGVLVSVETTENQKLTAPAAPAKEGYVFVSWGCDNPSGTYAVGEYITLANNAVFTANYSINTYSATLGADSSSNATVTGIPATVDAGEQVKFKATADENYEIAVVFAIDSASHIIPINKLDGDQYFFNMPASNVSIKVITREADSYTVKVDNGTASEDVKVSTGKTYTLPSSLNSSVVVPENSVWVGWKDADTSLVYDAGSTITANKNYRFVPAFNAVAAHEFTGTFCAEGVLVSVKTTEGQVLTAPAAPAKEGYIFTYWSCDDPAGTYAVGENITLSNNALFTANYSVSSYTAILSGDSSENVTVTGIPAIVNAGGQVNFTATPDAGYEISTVYAIDGALNVIPVTKLEGNQYAFTMPAGDVSVKVVTREADSYTIKVDNGSASENVKCFAGKTYTLPSTLNDSVKVPKNSIWIGWKDVDTSLVYAAGSIITANKDYSFAPEFKVVPPQEYVGTFYSNGLLVAVLTTKDQALTVPAAPAKKGYTFTSWSSENPLGKYAVGAKVTLTKDSVFTANYSVNNYKVTLNSNSSSNATVKGFPSAADVGKLVNFTTAAKHGHIITGVKVINKQTNELVNVHTGATNTVNGATYSFTMPDAPVSIKVDTLKNEYNVIYINDNGAFICGEEIAYNQTARVSMSTVSIDTNKEGYHFVGWTSADTQTPVTSPSLDDAKFVVVKNTYIKAVFAKDEIDVHFMPTEHGTVTELTTGKTGESFLDTTVFGDTISFTVDPDDGYEVDSVTLSTIGRDGNPIMIIPMVVDNTYSFVIPATYKSDASKAHASDIEVSVNFQKTNEETVAPKLGQKSDLTNLIIGLAAAALAIAIAVAIALIIILARRKRNTND